jgi:uncharacterized protein YcbK (DUF882 family)
VFLHQAIVSIPTTTLALVFSLLAHRLALIGMLMFAAIAGATQAAAEDRALKLFFTHTGERATIVYKRNGQFDQKGLVQINRFLRDWRKNEPTKIDLRLLDLVWEVYQRSGAKQPIHVVSAYRSPSTNNMLRNRSRSTGVAKKSQHMLGKAMDFYIPGVKLTTLRGLAMQMQVGGVGYYPTSGSPFVHLDVGNVRAWPRMSRQELARLFPSGRTLHLPTDGRPLPGYEVAIANQKSRIRTSAIAIARDADDEDDAGSVTTAATGLNTKTLATALLPIPKSRAEKGLALQIGRPVDDAGSTPTVADMASMVIPMPTLRPDRNDGAVSSTSVKAAPALFASLVVGRSAAGELLVAEHPKSLMTNTQVMPASSVPQMSAGVGTISAEALVAWAMQPPGTSIEMTAPRPFGIPLPEEHDATEQTGDASDVAEDRFNADRFAFEG